MIDFDLTDFCNLSNNEKALLRSHVNSAIASNSLSEIKERAKDCFKIIAPNIDVNLLLSSVKKFSELRYTENNVYAGICVYRSFFAHLIYRKRKNENYPRILNSDFDKYGFMKIHSLLNYAMLESVRKELESFPTQIPPAVSKNSENIIHNLKGKPTLSYVLHDSDMKKYVFSCIGYPLDHEEATSMYLQNTFVQKLCNKNTDGDVQKVLHSDTFFPCVKWWYFPYEITLDSGPFAYVQGSNKFSYDIAEFIYRQSINIIRNEIIPERTYGHEEGSLRIFELEVDKMLLSEVKLLVSANTLIIANVFGFHRRSQVKNEAKRVSIHGSIRTNYPFD